ncbi:MAG TPA: hypothetical protein VKT78_02670 [Fimbriimonadaceae bacterium]|nr:hypothetical protein [Fimbriimonadaceae bacterium]
MGPLHRIVMGCGLVALTFSCAAARAAGAGSLRQADAQAKALRQAALTLRTKADQDRKDASQKRQASAEEADRAAKLRGQAADAKAKGNDTQADSLNKQALQLDNAAQEDTGAAERAETEAKGLEFAADAKEAEARGLEASSKSAADQLYRKLRDAVARAQADLADLKQFQVGSRVGRQAMSARTLFSNIHDESLKSFGQADLDALFAPFEEQLGALARTVETNRDIYGTGGWGADGYCNECYYDLSLAAMKVEEAEFSLVSRGFDTYEADIYKVERRLNAEWKQEDDALAASNETDTQKQADRAALRKKQSGERQATFLDVAKRYRADKNRLAIFRQAWVDEITGWHDVAAKLSQGDDVHRRGGSQRMDSLLSGWFSTGAVNQPESLGMFAFSIDSPDRFNTEYGDFDWCKARPFPDIQPEGSPGQLRMTSLIEKLPLLTRGGKYDGAARSSGP